MFVGVVTNIGLEAGEENTPGEEGMKGGGVVGEEEGGGD